MFSMRKQLPHCPPAFVSSGSWFFITLCCQRRNRNQLCLPGIGSSLIEDAINYHRQRSWVIHLFLLMPDHVHLIAGFPPDKIMSDVIRNWKRLTARRAKIEWQRNYFDHRLRPGENLQQKTDYIRQNPVRAGLIRNADDWPHFADYRTLEGR